MTEYFNTLHTNEGSSDPSIWDLDYSSETTASVSDLEDWPDILKRKNSQKLGAKVKRVYMHTQPKQPQADSWRLSGNPKPESRVPSSKEPLRAKVKRVNIYHPSSEIQPESSIAAEPTSDTAPEQGIEETPIQEAQNTVETLAQDTLEVSAQNPESPESKNSFTPTPEQQIIEAVYYEQAPVDKLIRENQFKPEAQRIANEIAEENKATEVANNAAKNKKYEGKHFAKESETLLKQFKRKIVSSNGWKKVASLVATVAFATGLAACTGDIDNQPTEATAIVDSIKDIDYSDPNIGQDHKKVDLDTVFGDSEIFGKEGIYDGYGEKGMWLSNAKGGAYDFASAKEAAEVCGNDAREIVKYAAENQVECFADYLANLPEELQPEGFKGLTILETEHKLESLSKEEFTSVMEYFKSTMSGAFTREITLDGTYHNAYMRLIDPSKPATHDNMELVTCTTEEHGTKATEFYWTDDGTPDGNVIGSMIVKIQYDENGNATGGCIQVVLPDGTVLAVYEGMREVKENPPVPSTSETPTEIPSETPSETPTEPQTEVPTEPNPEIPTRPEVPTEPEPEIPTEPDDSKNANAIWENMDHQGRLTQKGPGELSERPDTSRDSYQAELDYKEQQKDEARNTVSESKQGVTVGDIINNADQTYANHGNYTEEQQQAQAQQTKAEESQKAADNAAYEMQYTAQQNSQMSDAEAAEWFNSTISQGNNG